MNTTAITRPNYLKLGGILVVSILIASAWLVFPYLIQGKQVLQNVGDISVDTERDTPDITHQYAAGFSDRIIGLSGSYDQIATAANSFDVSYAVTKSQANYVVQHTTHIFLLDTDGRMVDTFAMTTKPADIAAALNALAR